MDCSQPKLHRDLSFSNWCYEGTAFATAHPGACIRGRSSDEFSSDSTDSSDAPHERPPSISDWLHAVGAEPQARPCSRSALSGSRHATCMPWHPVGWQLPGTWVGLTDLHHWLQAHGKLGKEAKARGAERTRRRWRLRPKRAQAALAQEVSSFFCNGISVPHQHWMLRVLPASPCVCTPCIGHFSTPPNKSRTCNIRDAVCYLAGKVSPVLCKCPRRVT